MIEQSRKPVEEILGYLEGKYKEFPIGCGGFVTIFHTGAESGVNRDGGYSY